MSNVWFTSDTHYGHAKIIGYAKRPFSNVDEMNEAMIANWNRVVKPGDTVYHLGDFAFLPPPDAVKVVKRLQGNKHIVWGNHDHKRLLKVPEFAALWQSSHHLTQISVAGHTIILCHYAMRVWNKSHHGSWQLFGHSHGTLQDDPGSLSLDVGVDCWGYTPASIEQIAERMKSKHFVPVDRHGT